MPCRRRVPKGALRHWSRGGIATHLRALLTKTRDENLFRIAGAGLTDKRRSEFSRRRRVGWYPVPIQAKGEEKHEEEGRSGLPMAWLMQLKQMFYALKRDIEEDFFVLCWWRRRGKDGGRRGEGNPRALSR